ncbi:hypothetical protein [Streptomyces sp. NPDC089799]|uniref:hypothetical protein n=1 Tax=Streptomyces sp. NPDC089799 TaxID=3155066 RepID=UPI00342115F1
MSHDDRDEPYDPYSTLGGTRQTRTRLPEAPGDTHGDRRRPARSSRGLVTVVGVVVLLIAAIAFANQGGDDTSDDDGAKTPTASGTAPTGVRPVDGKNNGIPSGFAQNEQGAQSAAANFAVALGSDGMFNPVRRRAIVDAIADDGAREKLQSGFDADYSAALLAQIGLTGDGVAPAGSTFVSRTVPAGTKVQNFSGGAAAVDVWCFGMFGLAGEKSIKPVTSNWFTMSVTLRWNGSDWRVTETAQKAGPTPISGDSPVSPSDEIAGAVEQFGGFTYAR